MKRSGVVLCRYFPLMVLLTGLIDPHEFYKSYSFYSFLLFMAGADTQ